MCLDVAIGIALPDAKKYKFGIFIQDHEIKTGDPKNNISDAKGGYNLWTERLKKTIGLPVGNIKKVGAIFAYLIDPNNNLISYKKLKASDYTYDKKNPKTPEW